jgi:AcrR family transcriptional regulator
MTVRATSQRPSSDTKTRIFDSAEDLFVEAGFEALSLREITSRAQVNLAAVNYHFGSKEALIHAMLSRRLDPLNRDRLALLDRFEHQLGPRLSCEHVLGAMFIPALRLARQPSCGGARFLKLLGRAYSDPSSFVREFLAEHYAMVNQRFFSAFQSALPDLPRAELGWRLDFTVGAVAGLLAGADHDRLAQELAPKTAPANLQAANPEIDSQLISRTASLIIAALRAQPPDAAQLAVFERVLMDAAAPPDKMAQSL